MQKRRIISKLLQQNTSNKYKCDINNKKLFYLADSPQLSSIEKKLNTHYNGDLNGKPSQYLLRKKLFVTNRRSKRIAQKKRMRYHDDGDHMMRQMNQRNNHNVRSTEIELSSDEENDNIYNKNISIHQFDDISLINSDDESIESTENINQNVEFSDIYEEYELLCDNSIDEELMFDQEKLKHNQQSDVLLSIVIRKINNEDYLEEWKDLPPRMKSDLKKDKYYI